MLNSPGNKRLQMNQVATAMIRQAPKEPWFKAFWGLPPSFVRTRNVPAIENRMPAPAITSGSRMNAMLLAPSTVIVRAQDMAATIAPT
jgi:hypothetical protein